MDHNSTVKGFCRHCEIKTQWKLGRTIAANGANMVYWVCRECKQRAEKVRFIKHNELHKRKIEIEKIEVVEDNTFFESCARCGKRNTEYHHWAPRHLFENADQWPGDYLCKDCHKEWHDIVTPHMCEKKQ